MMLLESRKLTVAAVIENAGLREGRPGSIFVIAIPIYCIIAIAIDLDAIIAIAIVAINFASAILIFHLSIIHHKIESLGLKK